MVAASPTMKYGERASKYCIDGRQKLPKVAVELASQNFRLFSSKLAHVAESKDTQTTKLVIERGTATGLKV